MNDVHEALVKALEWFEALKNTNDPHIVEALINTQPADFGISHLRRASESAAASEVPEPDVLDVIDGKEGVFYNIWMEVECYHPEIGDYSRAGEPCKLAGNIKSAAAVDRLVAAYCDDTPNTWTPEQVLGYYGK